MTWQPLFLQQLLLVSLCVPRLCFFESDNVQGRTAKDIFLHSIPNLSSLTPNQLGQLVLGRKSAGSWSQTQALSGHALTVLTTRPPLRPRQLLSGFLSYIAAVELRFSLSHSLVVVVTFPR